MSDSFSLQVRISEEAVARANRLLEGVSDGATRALRGAITRGQSKLKTEALRAIPTVYTISRKNIREKENIYSKVQQVGNEIVGTVTLAGQRIPLYRFDVNSTDKPIGARIMRTSGYKSSRRAFFVHFKSDHKGIFYRDQKGERTRYGKIKLHERMGLSVAHMVKNTVVAEKAEQAAQEVVEKRIEQEIHRLLNGYGG